LSAEIPGGHDQVTFEAHQLADRARLLESLGYAHIWAGDVIGRPHTLTPDPLCLLSIVAASTTRVELGTCILQVPLRYPAELAHRLLTLHEMSSHRFLLGAGAGSTPGDFAGMGLDFEKRFTMLRTSLQTMRALWRAETVNGMYFRLAEQAMGGPPVLIGSWGGTWVQSAAMEYDGWIGSGANRTWGDLERTVQRFRSLGGKRAVLSSVHMDINGHRPGTRFNAVQLECGPKEAVRRLQRLEDMGFTDVSVSNVGAASGVQALAEALP
jgi:alkanesulfonate monooxygenase SsuD/methylene tetrahydromethanopterin reductase-like flavin-dependent oxidoreductase (luciferase family)